MKSTIQRIVFVLIFLLLHSPLCSAAVLDDVPEVQQERDKWCWAACSQATLAYYGVSVSQCAIANFARSQNDWGDDDCCANQHGDICNQENDLYGSAGSFQDILENWGVKSDERRYPLSQSAISSEINARRPFVIEWAWNTGGGHFLVGRGIEDNLVHYMDPWPGNGYQLASYEWVVEGSEHEWTYSLQITTNVLYTLTLYNDPPDGGSILSYNLSRHSYGEQVKLTAIPNAGYAFSNWSGDAAGSANPMTITMDSNKSVTANFTLLVVGDVNGDGEVTIVDVQAWVNHFLCVQDWGSAADVNGDGFVNATDLQMIINIIFGAE